MGAFDGYRVVQHADLHMYRSKQTIYNKKPPSGFYVSWPFNSSSMTGKWFTTQQEADNFVASRDKESLVTYKWY